MTSQVFHDRYEPCSTLTGPLELQCKQCKVVMRENGTLLYGHLVIIDSLLGPCPGIFPKINLHKADPLFILGFFLVPTVSI